MRVARDPTELDTRPRAVAIGSFDGVHRGHRAVIETIRATGLEPTVITFDPHPRIALGNRVELLTTLERRVELLGEAGVTDILVASFIPELQQLAPEEFADRYLRATGVVPRFAGHARRDGHCHVTVHLRRAEVVDRADVHDRCRPALDDVLVDRGRDEERAVRRVDGREAADLAAARVGDARLDAQAVVVAPLVDVDGNAVSYWEIGGPLPIVNLAGLPALAAPAGLDRAGLPIGIQIVGPLWSELRLLDIARTLERAEILPGFQAPPGC